MNNFHGGLSGCVEVICGPMFSGKTEELIRRVRRAQIARQKVQIFKPAIDDRYSETDIVSHNSLKIEGTPVSTAAEILENLYDSTRVVGIDEIQFFDEDIIIVVKKLSRRGIRVICAGLDQDFRGTPFGPIPTLLCIADRIEKIQAICTVCGNAASRTYRKNPESNSNQVLVGENDLYEARCAIHWNYDQEDEDLRAYFALKKNMVNQSQTTTN